MDGRVIQGNAMAKISRAAPATEPVTSAEVKEWLRVDSGDSSQDAVITTLIKAGRTAIEEYTNRALVDQVITWTLDAFDTVAPIWVPIADASAITSITTYNGKAGADDTVVAVANYELVGNKIVTRADGWSTSQTYGSAEIVYVAGYGAASDVPSDIKVAILMWISTIYENREDAVVGTIAAKMPRNVIEVLREGGYIWGWN